MNVVENPFPISAVAVFDAELGPTVEFEYMRDVRRPVYAYLEGYPNRRCGLALTGGHGSGKTHLLRWLTQEVEKVGRAEAQVLYAKPNTSDIVELYRQLLSKMSRDKLLEVHRRALIAFGSRKAGAVKATEAEGRDIQDFDSLGRAFHDKVLDVNEVQIELREALAAATGGADVSGRVAAALGLLDDTTFGAAAFTWLGGNAGPTLPNSALHTEIFAGEGDKAAKVVQALATLAALYKIAGTPLVVLLDEMEKFLSIDDSIRKTSNLKEIVEQLSVQGAAIVMAGTPAGWDLMPRDVGPRLIQRDPLRVGALNLDECRDLLNFQVQARLKLTTPLPEDAVVGIHDLSGGNPREILRIANRAFEQVGDVTGFTPAVLAEGAKMSGTLADRELLALQLIDEVTRELGLVVMPAEFPIKCRVGPAGGPALPVALAIAADPKAESEFGRALTRTLRTGAKGGLEPFVIAIGYSSERVRGLLQGVAEILVFDETGLKPKLRAVFERLKTAAPAPAPAPAQDQEMAARLKQLDQLLAGVEQARAAADRQVAEMLAAQTTIAAAPEREAAEVRTRYELRDGLDELGEALAHREPEVERRAIRRLLIANETNVKDQTFDYLGSVYLDALDLERIQRSEKIAEPEGFDIWDAAFAELRSLRGDIVGAMRSTLTQQRTLGGSSRSVRVSLAAGGAILAAILVYILTAYGKYRDTLDSYSRYMKERLIDSPLQAVPAPPMLVRFLIGPEINTIMFCFVLGALIGLATFFVLETMNRPEVRYRQLRNRLADTRTELERRPPGVPPGLRTPAR